MSDRIIIVNLRFTINICCSMFIITGNFYYTSCIAPRIVTTFCINTTILNIFLIFTSAINFGIWFTLFNELYLETVFILEMMTYHLFSQSHQPSLEIGNTNIILMHMLQPIYPKICSDIHWAQLSRDFHNSIILLFNNLLIL